MGCLSGDTMVFPHHRRLRCTAAPNRHSAFVSCHHFVSRVSSGGVCLHATHCRVLFSVNPHLYALSCAWQAARLRGVAYFIYAANPARRDEPELDLHPGSLHHQAQRLVLKSCPRPVIVPIRAEIPPPFCQPVTLATSPPTSLRQLPSPLDAPASLSLDSSVRHELTLF